MSVLLFVLLLGNLLHTASFPGPPPAVLYHGSQGSDQVILQGLSKVKALQQNFMSSRVAKNSFSLFLSHHMHMHMQTLRL